MTGVVVGAWEYAHPDHSLLLDELARLRRMKADLDAYEIECLASIETQPDPYADGTGAAESKHFVREDVAATLRIGSGAAHESLELSARLMTLLPVTMQAMRDGLIPGYYARRLAEDTQVLPDHAALRVEATVLPKASDQTYGQFCRALRRAIAKHDTRTSVEEQRAARETRMVRFSAPDAFGMGELWARLPADELAAMSSRVEAVAHGGRTEAASADGCGMGGRTRDQREADALVALVTGGGHLAAPAKPVVNVVVSLSTLLGISDEPGELDGNLVPAELARAVAHDSASTWRRLVTDELGRIIDLTSATYRPPAAMARIVQLRHPTCVFPTCERRAVFCELDHTNARAGGGATRVANLMPLCTRHHHLKHDGGWHVIRDPDGGVRWRSRVGHRYRKPPPAPPPADVTMGAARDDPPF